MAKKIGNLPEDIWSQLLGWNQLASSGSSVSTETSVTIFNECFLMMDDESGNDESAYFGY